jgi:putative endonuclease
MWFVYVLRGETGTFYIGFTSDVEARLGAHNAGLNTATRGQCWVLVYYEAYASEEAARDRERVLKHDGRSRRALMERIKRHLE